MTYTYTWTTSQEDTLRREDEEGNIAIVPIDPRNRDYAEFLTSGATVGAYVAPPEPTTKEKLARSGLTVDELKGLLGLTS